MSTPTMRTPMPELRQLEKDVQREQYKLLEAMGYWIGWMSQPRKSHQTTGLGDLYAMHKIRGVLWVESKQDEGKQSPAQRDFQIACLSFGVACVVGGVPELVHYLNYGKILRWPRRLQDRPELPNPAAGGRLLDHAIAEWNHRLFLART